MSKTARLCALTLAWSLVCSALSSAAFAKNDLPGGTAEKYHRLAVEKLDNATAQGRVDTAAFDIFQTAIDLGSRNTVPIHLTSPNFISNWRALRKKQANSQALNSISNQPSRSSPIW